MRRRAGLLLLLLLPACRTAPSHPVVLFDFEEEAELDLIKWRCRDYLALSTDWAASGSRSLRCEPSHRTYPGVTMRPGLGDWTPYRFLSLSLNVAATDTLPMVIRIDDKGAGAEYGNRYNGDFRLAPGENRIVVDLEEVRHAPVRRELDLSRIERIVIFFRKPEVTPVFYIDTVILR